MLIFGEGMLVRDRVGGMWIKMCRYLVVDGGDDGREEAVLHGLVLPVDRHVDGAWLCVLGMASGVSIRVSACIRHVLLLMKVRREWGYVEGANERIRCCECLCIEAEVVSTRTDQTRIF